jgi:sugar O-acyltransferase (sialic acid O-acetyltransferase NeuD family)
MNDVGGVFVFGASGHAKVVIDAIERTGRNTVLFVCDDAKDKRGGRLMGYTIVGGREELLARRSETHVGIVGIGDNEARMQVAAWLLSHECALTRVVHPAASIGREVNIEDGTVVMAGCVINAGTRVGRNVIVNSGATVDHDCEVGEGAHVGPGSHICGHVTIGARTLIGAGTTVIPGVRIGSGAVIGAGSTVLTDVPDGVRAGGSPCRPLVGAR